MGGSAGDQRLYCYQNTQYSTYALTDASGNIVERYLYDAYGRSTVIVGNVATPGGFIGPPGPPPGPRGGPRMRSPAPPPGGPRRPRQRPARAPGLA